MSRKLSLFFIAVLLVLSAAALLAAWNYAHREITLTIGVYAGSYWETPNGNSYQILDNAIRRFEEQHPEIHVEYASGIPTDAYSEWLAEQILKGKEPDLYFVLPEDFNLLVTTGALARLDSLMDADPDFDEGLFYPPCLRSGRFQNGQYALPHESVPTLMFVNKTLLEEKGIPIPDDDWTWKDLYRICEQVTDIEARQFGVYDYTWLHALYANGASLFSEDGSACYLSDSRIQDAIQFVGQLEELNGGYTVTSRDFDLGNVAFRPFLFSEYRAYQPYPWRVKKYSHFQWDCVCMPAGPDGDNRSELHTMLLGISSRTRRQAMAWEFAKMLTLDEQVQRELYTYSRGISPLPAVAEDPDMLAVLHADIPGGGGFGPEVIHDIMSMAVVTPRFDGYDQALIMAESAVADELSRDPSRGNGVVAAQRAINLFLIQF
ncbi:MAG: extracellular solute-binding protein [Oscillibacter sp.]|nr:extracellular solute-binding protein [Oscillibacter sp.]